GRDGQRADGLRRLIIENGRPSLAEVGGLPDAAVVNANVKDIGLGRNAGRGDGASATEGADHSPAHLLKQIGIELGGGKRGEEHEKQRKKTYHGVSPLGKKQDPSTACSFARRGGLGRTPLGMTSPFCNATSSKADRINHWRRYWRNAVCSNTSPCDGC